MDGPDTTEAMQSLAEHLVAEHGHRVAWQQLMTAACWVLMGFADDKSAAALLRSVADRIAAGEGAASLN